MLFSHGLECWLGRVCVGTRLADADMKMSWHTIAQWYRTAGELSHSVQNASLNISKSMYVMYRRFSV